MTGFCVKHRKQRDGGFDVHILRSKAWWSDLQPHKRIGHSVRGFDPAFLGTRTGKRSCIGHVHQGYANPAVKQHLFEHR